MKLFAACFFAKTGLTDAAEYWYTLSNAKRKGAASHDVRSMEHDERHDDVRGYVHVHVLRFAMRSPPCINSAQKMQGGRPHRDVLPFLFLRNGTYRKE